MIAYSGIILILAPREVDDPARLAKYNYCDVVMWWLEYVANRDVATLYATTVDLPSCSALLFAYTWWRLSY